MSTFKFRFEKIALIHVIVKAGTKNQFLNFKHLMMKHL